jgi:hypothetical protein
MRQSADAFSFAIRSGDCPVSSRPFRQLPGVLFFRQALLLRVLLVEPVLEVLGVEIGEVEKQIREIALGVNDDRGNAVDGCLFEEVDAQAGLARAGHADDHAVRGQIAGVVHDVFVRQHFVLAEVVLAPQVKAGGLFDIEGHGRSLRGG